MTAQTHVAKSIQPQHASKLVCYNENKIRQVLSSALTEQIKTTDHVLPRQDPLKGVKHHQDQHPSSKATQADYANDLANHWCRENRYSFDDNRS